jgi:limonene-1,2-epoxide hydrolase
MPQKTVNRRRAIQIAGLVLLAADGFGTRLQAAEMTAAEKSNVQVVKAFCAAWRGHDVAKIMSYMADPCAYRVTEEQDPIKGRDAVTKRVRSSINSVNAFDVLETFAKGPMVFNERIDTFTSGQLKSWHGVGVFFLKDGKIVEWQDYTIKIERR